MDRDPSKNKALEHDLPSIEVVTGSDRSYTARIHTVDELLERDKQREEDGFPRKIRVGRMIKPGKGDKDKIVIVPTTVEEKFIHDRSYEEEEEGASGGK